MIRYAEVILNEAEARVETNDIQGALKAVNEIRARVGLPAYTENKSGKTPSADPERTPSGTCL